MDGIRLTGLWRNERDGKPYLAGSLGGGRLLVFPNDRKAGERDPDFVVYLVPAERREGGGRQAAGGGDFDDAGPNDAGDPFGGGSRRGGR